METKEQLQAQLDTMKSGLETLAKTEAATAATSAATKAINDMQIALETKNAAAIKQSFTDNLPKIKEVLPELAEIKGLADWKVKKDETDKANQEVIDNAASFMKNFKLNGPAPTETLNDAMFKEFSAKQAELKEYKNVRRSINFDIKAVGIMGDTNFTVSGTQGFLPATVIPGVGRKPYEDTHVRDLMTKIPLQGDTMYMIRDSGGEGAPTSVAKGGLKPQSDRDWVKLVVPVTKIGHHYRIPEEWLDDAAWLAGEISSVGIEELLFVEDDKILNNVTAGEFQGLTTATNSTAFDAPDGLQSQLLAPNNYDVLVAALTQLRNLKVSGATAIIVNPSDYAVMILTKSAADGHYLFGAPGITVPNVWGVPLYPHTAMTQDKFLVGDFRQAILGERKGISVRFYDQDQDNAVKNLVTVVIEERIAAAARRTDRLIYGDFGDAKVALSNGASPGA